MKPKHVLALTTPIALALPLAVAGPAHAASPFPYHDTGRFPDETYDDEWLEDAYPHINEGNATEEERFDRIRTLVRLHQEAGFGRVAVEPYEEVVTQPDGSTWMLRAHLIIAEV